MRSPTNRQRINTLSFRPLEFPNRFEYYEYVPKELVFLVEEAPEGGFTARALGEPIFTEADSMDELRERIRDAVQCHFDEDHRPDLIRIHFIREEVIAP